MKFLKKKNEKEPKEINWPKYVEELNEKNFDEFIQRYPLCFIDFWAPWCKPCNTMSPRVRRLSKIFEGKVAFGKINTQKNGDISKRFKIMSIPTLILFKNGKEKATLTGVKSVGSIKKIIIKHL